MVKTVTNKKTKTKRKKIKYRTLTCFNGLYSFYSDYFKIGKYYYTIVSLLSTDVQADLPAFWSRWIEQGIEDIDYTVLKKYRKHTFSDNEKKNVDKMFVKMNKRLKRMKDNRSFKAQMALPEQQESLFEVLNDLQNKDMLFKYSYSILFRSTDFGKLEKVVKNLNIDIRKGLFKRMSIDSYSGRQEEFFNSLATSNAPKQKVYDFSTSELAGEYGLFSSPTLSSKGVVAGNVIGDFYKGGLIVDFNNFNENIIIASKTHASQMLEKVEKSAIIQNEHIYRIFFDEYKEEENENLNRLRASFSLEEGTINPFEFFGKVEDELTVFSNGIDRITEIFNLFVTEKERSSIINSDLKNMLEQFYITKRMWTNNAKENREQLRVITPQHNEVPRLRDFIQFLKSQMEQRSSGNQDLGSVKFIIEIFNMIMATPYLFDVHTNDMIDEIGKIDIVDLDLTKLRKSDPAISSTLALNFLSYIENSTVPENHKYIIELYGADKIDPNVKKWITKTFDGTTKYKFVFIYNSTDKIITDNEFNNMVNSDYLLCSVNEINKVNLKEISEKTDVPFPPIFYNYATQKNVRGDYFMFMSMNNGFGSVIKI